MVCCQHVGRHVMAWPISQVCGAGDCPLTAPTPTLSPSLACLPPPSPSGLAFNFMATFTRDGGIVPVVIPFKKGSGDPAAAVAQLVEAKASKTNPLDAVYVSTNNITFFTGAAATPDWCWYQHAWHVRQHTAAPLACCTFPQSSCASLPVTGVRQYQEPLSHAQASNDDAPKPCSCAPGSFLTCLCCVPRRVPACASAHPSVCPLAGFLRAAAAAKLGLPVFSGDAMANPEVAAMLQDNLALLRPVVITAFAQVGLPGSWSLVSLICCNPVMGVG